MREIKFRAWDRERKQIGDVDQMTMSPTISGWRPHPENKNWSIHLVDGENADFMQFTGLKDKNGKEIYEGDILAINNISNIKYEVRFGNYEPYGSNERQQGFYLYDDSDNSTIPLTENYKIVGNIYENPELLGGAS